MIRTDGIYSYVYPATVGAHEKGDCDILEFGEDYVNKRLYVLPVWYFKHSYQQERKEWTPQDMYETAVYCDQSFPPFPLEVTRHEDGSLTWEMDYNELLDIPPDTFQARVVVDDDKGGGGGKEENTLTITTRRGKGDTQNDKETTIHRYIFTKLDTQALGPTKKDIRRSYRNARAKQRARDRKYYKKLAQGNPYKDQ